MDRSALHGGILSTAALDDTAKTRLGLIGVGPWGRNYVRTISATPDIALAAVTSRNPATAKLVGAQCAIFTSWEDMLDAGGIDGIVVALPPSMQAKIALAAMRRQLPLLLEKPIALAVEAASELIAVAGSTDALVHVDHTDLFNPALRALRDQIASPSDILSLRGEWSNDGPVRSDVRGLWDYGAHAAAVSLDIMGGEPEEISATWIKKAGDRELAAVELHWGNITADLTFGNGSAGRARWLDIDTGDQRLRYDDITDQKATIDGRPIDYPRAQPLTVAVERFVRAIKHAEPDAADLLLGAASVRTLVAIQGNLETSL